MEQGRKALSAFDIRCNLPSKDINKILQRMKKDYEEILYELKDFNWNHNMYREIAYFIV